MRGTRTLIAVLFATLAIGGCGGSNGPSAHPGLTAAQRQGLLAQLEATRAAADGHDLVATKAALATFRRSVARLRRSGALTDAGARALRVGAARVLARAESDNAAPAPTPPLTATQPAPEPGPPAEPPGQAKKHGEKPGHGHGKGPKH